MRCLRGVVVERQKNPRDDLVTALVSADLGGDALSTREIVEFGLLLIVASNETTTNLIGNTVEALYEHPGAMKRLAMDPGEVPKAIDEGLRFDSPVQTVFRVTTEATELRGESIEAGRTIAVLIGSANRDERRFAELDRFDLDRDRRGHLGFGFGHHYCLGASLAGFEARAALAGLAPELPRTAAESGPLERLDSFLVRGVKRLGLRPAA